jgi:CHAD domain-containing protein
MGSHVTAVFPVRLLQEQVTALEAAVLVVLNKPGKKAVHRIRTASRRIEAQLQLLNASLPGKSRLRSQDGYVKAQQAVAKQLKSLRKAAGKVRDLDVQRALLEDVARRSRNSKIREQAEHLRQTLKRKRRQRAKALQTKLEKHLDRLTPALEALLGVLRPVEDLRLTELQLMRITRDWFSSPNGEVVSGIDSRKLHTARKRATLARYMAGSAGSEHVRAASTAAQLKALQEAGGTWHDLLTLAALSAQALGKSSTLAHRFAQQEQSARRDFTRMLSSSHTPHR